MKILQTRGLMATVTTYEVSTLSQDTNACVIYFIYSAQLHSAHSREQ